MLCSGIQLGTMVTKPEDESVPEKWDPPALPTPRAGSAGDALHRLWGEQPDETHEVVVVLAPESEDVAPDSLGLSSFEPIPYQPGMYKASMCGADLLRLAARPEIAEIAPDEEVTAF